MPGEPNLRLRFDFSTAGTMNDATEDSDGHDIDSDFGEFTSDDALDPQPEQRRSKASTSTTSSWALRNAAKWSPRRRPTTQHGHHQSGRPNGADEQSRSGSLSADLAGPYQVEVRRSYEYEVLTDPDEPDTVIFQTFDTNERMVMGHTIVAPERVDGQRRQTFTIVGRWEQVFEFNSAGGVSDGQYRASTTPRPTTKISGRQAIAAAINGVTDFGVIAIVHTAPATSWTWSGPRT